MTGSCRKRYYRSAPYHSSPFNALSHTGHAIPLPLAIPDCPPHAPKGRWALPAKPQRQGGVPTPLRPGARPGRTHGAPSVRSRSGPVLMGGGDPSGPGRGGYPHPPGFSDRRVPLPTPASVGGVPSPPPAACEMVGMRFGLRRRNGFVDRCGGGGVGTPAGLSGGATPTPPA